LSDDAFIESLARLLDRRRKPEKPGPKPIDGYDVTRIPIDEYDVPRIPPVTGFDNPKSL
jgi:hypothetical protein